MAASMGNRHQPDHSDQEQQQNRRSRLHPRQHDYRGKQVREQQMNPTPSPLPQRSQRLARLHLAKRESQEQRNLKPLPPRQPLQQAISPPPPQLRQSRLGLGLIPQIPKLRVDRNPTLRQTSNPGRELKGRSVAQSNTPQGLQPLTDASKRRRDSKRDSIPSVLSPVSVPTRRNETRRNQSSLNSQPTPSPKTRRTRRTQKQPFNPFVYIIRLLILGIGIGAIAGTLFSTFDPASQLPVNANDTSDTPVQERSSTANPGTAMSLRQEISPLKSQIQALAAQNSKLQPGIFLVDLDTGTYVDWQGQSILPAASTIKVPILVAFFQDVDAGKIRLDEPLTLEPDVIGTGSGELQYQKLGHQYTALEVVTKMSAISDNTATNMIIKRLGGAAVLNQRFQSWGLTATVINNPLPDLEGTNTTTARDLGNLMGMLNQGQLLTLRSRDRLLNIMQQTVNNSLLPKGLGSGATIAHKTGDIGSLVGDVGLVDMPNGKRYIIVTMVKRPHNDGSASELIRNISRTVYNYFNQPHSRPTKQAGTAGVS